MNATQLSPGHPSGILQTQSSAPGPRHARRRLSAFASPRGTNTLRCVRGALHLVEQREHLLMGRWWSSWAEVLVYVPDKGGGILFDPGLLWMWAGKKP